VALLLGRELGDAPGQNFTCVSDVAGERFDVENSVVFRRLGARLVGGFVHGSCGYDVELARKPHFALPRKRKKSISRECPW